MSEMISDSEQGTVVHGPDRPVDQMAGVERDGTFHDERYGRASSATTPPSTHYVNAAGLTDAEMMTLRNNSDIANAIELWNAELRDGPRQPSLDLFNRTRWNGANHIFAQMSRAAYAVESDDILSTLADVTEGLTFHKCRFELNDDDEQDVWNQWARDIDLDSFLRQQMRELFKVSQFYVGLWWENKVYTVRDKQVADVVAEQSGKTRPSGRGNRTRRKKYPLSIPTAVTIFDPTKILPVGQLMFGKERFAYIASRAEDLAFERVMSAEIADGTVLQLIERRYPVTDPAERAELTDMGVNPDQLWLMKADAVFRHTLTRSAYERFAAVRLKPVMQILEMKQHLRNADRATLVGQTNFIIVVTKGSDKLPAKQAEIDNLNEQVRTVARLPVLVGDHRLHVEIVSPANDYTLIESRWQVLDSRLVFTALRSFQPIVQGGNASSGVSEMSRVVASGLEDRRHLIVRSLEKFIFSKVMERNEGVLKEFPSLSFNPKRIALDFKADIANILFKARDRGDLSRETFLDEMDFDQDVEALRRARERENYDEVFQTSVPYSAPGANPFSGQPGANQPGTSADGGRPAGVTEDEPRVPADSSN